MKFPHPGKTTIWVVVIMVGIIAGSGNAKAQSPAPAPEATVSDCLTPILNMSDCLTYVGKGSNETKPDKACCPELAGLLEANPICLCHLLGKSSDIPLDLNLDLNRALKLPAICGLTSITPPVSTCALIGIPVGAPAPGEGPSTGSPGMPSMMAGEGASPPSLGNNGPSIRYVNLPYLIAGLAVALISLSTL